jgi:sirohydrochlorin ferrochelatase
MPGAPLPRRGAPLPQRGGDLPQRRPDPDSGGLGDVQPQPLPRRGDPLPRRGDPLPQRGNPLPQRGDPLPQRGEPLPQRAESLPQRGESADSVQPLPRRTRSRPPGRHRSPHRLSVASDAPALVLAVPGTAAADATGIGPTVASIAELSCPGVDIRVGYLDGAESRLSDCLGSGEPDAGEHDQFPCVIVPLLLSPNPRIDPALKRAAAVPGIHAVLAAHLGPHPLVAEALHARLAEAGLARHARAVGLSIAADNRGIVVLADTGEEAVSAAAVAAVLLASRLSVPVVPASLGDPASIVNAVDRLSQSGAQRPVLAPCLIGPELSAAVLDDLSAALAAPCAPMLGAHQAIGQLVAIRYGAALASLSLAG